VPKGYRIIQLLRVRAYLADSA